MNNNKFKIGNKIVEDGQVFKIVKIEKKKGSNGQSVRILHYKHHFKSSDQGCLRCSVPEENVEMANIRRPISKEEAKKVVQRLKVKARLTEPVDTNEAKLRLKQNDIFETTEVVREFWRAKHKDSDKFTKTKRDLLENALGRIVEEVALIWNVSMEKAEEKLLHTLEK